MPGKSSSADNVFGGPWSLAKLNCVEHYLDAYLQVMSRQPWCQLWYIDAFCGDGFQRFKDPVSEAPLFYSPDILTFTEGSALRALKLSQTRETHHQRGFDHFAFIEMDEAKLASLRQRVQAQYPSQLPKCTFICGDVNKELPLLLKRIPWRQGGRAVCFIDPFATQMQWSTLETLRDTATDTWYLFPVSAIIRLLPRFKMPENPNQHKLDVFFGDSSWQKLYSNPHSNQLSLFDGAESEVERKEGPAELLSYTKTRLKTIFPGVFGPGILKTSGNAPLFALFALVSNPSSSALNIAERISEHLIREINDFGGKRL